ncbi:hypothetical protein PAHAL_3G313200 [Panicum hallii]|uniref:Uncharacterized protein n=1 Tax=Panicum hallii TaxID=206008 RepID=A0A2T8KK06_9POAL|nr:hypothetical protein PAHAL_3G313200 [Panicum hallii]
MATSEEHAWISIFKEMPRRFKDKLVAGATCFSTLPEPLAALIKQEELTGTVTRAPCCAPH